MVAGGVSADGGAEGGDLADDLGSAGVEVLGVIGVHHLRVVAAQAVEAGRQHRHRAGVAGEAVENFEQPLVDGRVLADAVDEGVELRLVRPVAVDQQVGGFEEAAAFGQFFDGNAAVLEDALLGVDEGDGALARAGVAVAGVEGDVAGFGPQGGDVDGPLALGADDDGQVDALAVVEAQRGGVGFGLGGGRRFGH